MTPPTCSCGAHYSRDTPQQAHCRPCIEKAAEKRSQGATSDDDGDTKKVYPREVQQLFDLISEGPFPCALIHAGGDYRVTWDYDAYHGYEALRRIVLVCDEHTTIEDIRREVA